MTGESHQRRQERERRDHHHRHNHCGTYAHEGDDRNAGHGESADGDHDRSAGDDDGLTGGGYGATRCILDGQAPVKTGTVTGDDEQRVIDPHSESDHRRHHLDGRWHVDERRDEEHESQPGTKAEQRHSDRQSHGDDRTEGEQQDDHRGEEADHFRTTGRRLFDEVGQFTTEFDLDAGIHSGRRCFLHLRIGVLGELSDFLVELDRRQGNRVVLRILHRERRRRCDSVRKYAESGHRFIDCDLGGLIGERSRFGVENNLNRSTGLRREGLDEEVGRHL
ncbi:unannotated protein [freshwater metagenome]|uniref:Unannotated protein n=1 Tax=freshwater metagenome TaxID=449393 RepID=A0A6J6IW40_9ZZZZ